MNFGECGSREREILIEFCLTIESYLVFLLSLLDFFFWVEILCFIAAADDAGSFNNSVAGQQVGNHVTSLNFFLLFFFTPQNFTYS